MIEGDDNHESCLGQCNYEEIKICERRFSKFWFFNDTTEECMDCPDCEDNCEEKCEEIDGDQNQKSCKNKCTNWITIEADKCEIQDDCPPEPNWGVNELQRLCVNCTGVDNPYQVVSCGNIPSYYELFAEADWSWDDPDELTTVRCQKDVDGICKHNGRHCLVEETYPCTEENTYWGCQNTCANCGTCGKKSCKCQVLNEFGIQECDDMATRCNIECPAPAEEEEEDED